MLLDTPYTTARIVEIADTQAPTNFNANDLKAFLLRVAAAKGKPGEASPERLGWWLRRISGRPVGKRRLIRGHDNVSNTATFLLTTTT
jgi:hypothetical protein